MIPTDNFTPARPTAVTIPVTIPAGTTYARFSLFDADVAPGADLDLYVFNGRRRSTRAAAAPRPKR